jgi:hypothetical protein
MQFYVCQTYHYHVTCVAYCNGKRKAIENSIAREALVRSIDRLKLQALRCCTLCQNVPLRKTRSEK